MTHGSEKGKGLCEVRDGTCMRDGWFSPECWRISDDVVSRVGDVDAMSEGSVEMIVHVSPRLSEALIPEGSRSACCATQGGFIPSDGCVSVADDRQPRGGSTGTKEDAAGWRGMGRGRA